MRIAVLSPYSRGPVRGNLITVQRILSALEAAGQVVVVMATDVMDEEEIQAGIQAFIPDVVLAFHAYYCGDIACRLVGRLNIPCVVTITGSDINEPYFREHPRTQSALEKADVIVCFDENAATLVNRYFPRRHGRLAIIPQGVECLALAGQLDTRISGDAFVLLLPAALRPVKNIELPLRALSTLAGQNHRLLLVIAGGVIDHDYAEQICEMMNVAPFALWLDEVPHERMGALYARADIVLNCSHYEGMPNSLLEAMVLARPVVAANIPGNYSLIRDKETGWLYSDAADLSARVQDLMDKPAVRAEAGRRAREFVTAHFSPRDEAARYIKLFTSLVKPYRLDN